MIAQNRRLIGVIVLILTLLSIPLIAMQFSNQVEWSAFDFLIAAILLIGTGLVFEIIFRKVKKKSKRIILFSVVVTLLLLIWLELAVGIFGTSFAGT